MKKIVSITMLIFCVLCLFGKEKPDTIPKLPPPYQKFNIEVQVGFTPLYGCFPDRNLMFLQSNLQSLNYDNYGDFYSYNNQGVLLRTDIKFAYNFIPSLIVAGGVRVSYNFGFVEKNDNYPIPYPYKNDNGTLYFANIDKITEHNLFIGIPISFTYKAFNVKYFGIDLDVNTSFNYRINNSLNINFTNKNLAANIKAETETALKENGLKNYYYDAGFGIMLRFGKSDKTHFKIGATFPCFINENNYITFVEEEFFNLKASVIIPLKN